MNEAHFIGRLAAEPILKKMPHPSGNGEVSMATFTLAVNRKHQNSTGKKVEKTQFIDFEVWDSAADAIGKYCKKGELLMITRCSAVSHVVTLEGGEKINRVIFRVDRFEYQSALFGRRNEKKTQDSVDG